MLRVVVGIAAMLQGGTLLNESELSAPAAWAVAIPTLCAGIALVVGFVTPIATAIVGIGTVVMMAGTQAHSVSAMQSPVYLLTMSVTVVLLGPGACSLDARMFGRREIVIPQVPSQTEESA